MPETISVTRSRIGSLTTAGVSGAAGRAPPCPAGTETPAAATGAAGAATAAGVSSDVDGAGGTGGLLNGAGSSTGGTIGEAPTTAPPAGALERRPAYGIGTCVTDVTGTAGAPRSTTRSRRWSTSSREPSWPESPSSQCCQAASSTMR